MACPFAGALLAGCVENDVHHRFAGVLIILREDVTRNFDQVAVKLALVPFRERCMQFFFIQTDNILKKLVGFADQLHIAVLDAVVDHLHIVARSVRSDICTAGFSVNLGRNSSQNWLNQLIGAFLSARHDGRSLQSAFFAAGYAGADEAEAFLFKLFVASNSIREVGVAAVDDDIPLIQVRNKLLNRRVGCFARLNHDQDFAGSFKRIHELLNGERAEQILAFRLFQKIMRLLRGTVEYRNGKASALDVESQVFAHNRQANNADLLFCHLVLHPLHPIFL
ncbi:hypothetical protein D3C71_1335920 [compost metagenome]